MRGLRPLSKSQTLGADARIGENSPDPADRGVSQKSDWTDASSDDGILSGASTLETIPQPKAAMQMRRHSAGIVTLKHSATFNATPAEGSAVVQRRSSLPGKLQSLEVADEAGRKSPVLGEEEASVVASAGEWTAKLQSGEDTRGRRRQACRGMMDLVEAYVPEISNLTASDRVRVVDKLEAEVNKLEQHLARAVYDQVRNDYEELQLKRTELTDLDQKMARINKVHLQEISGLRDNHRTQNDALQDATKKVDKSDAAVEFYEPLQFMSEELRATTMTILDEKIKAIFACDPNLKQQVNGAEMAKFEDTMMRDKVASFERMNSKMREELREGRTRLKKSEGALEKIQWELEQAQVEQWRTEKAKAAREDAEMQTDPPEVAKSNGVNKEIQTDALQMDALKELASSSRAASKTKGSKASPQGKSGSKNSSSKQAERQLSDAAGSDQATISRAESKQTTPKDSAPPSRRSSIKSQETKAIEPSAKKRPSKRPSASSDPRSRSRSPKDNADEFEAFEAEFFAEENGDQEGGVFEAQRQLLLERYEAMNLEEARSTMQERDATIHSLQMELAGQRQKVLDVEQQCSLTLDSLALTSEQRKKLYDIEQQSARQAMERAEELKQQAALALEQAKALAGEHQTQAMQTAKELHDQAAVALAGATMLQQRSEVTATTNISSNPFSASSPQETSPTSGEKRELVEMTDWESMVYHLREEARLAQEELEAVKEEAEQKQMAMFASASGGDSGLKDAFDVEVRARRALELELEDVKAGWFTMSSRNALLESALIALQGSDMPEVPEAAAAFAANKQEHRQLEIDTDQKKELNQKVTIQKAQLQAVIRENQVVHMALEELQQEVQKLTKQLRKDLPEDGGLEAVLGRMEKVARSGGGAYLRMHKEAELRKIGETVKKPTEDKTPKGVLHTVEPQQIAMPDLKPVNAPAPPAPTPKQKDRPAPEPPAPQRAVKGPQIALPLASDLGPSNGGAIFFKANTPRGPPGRKPSAGAQPFSPANARVRSGSDLPTLPPVDVPARVTTLPSMPSLPDLEPVPSPRPPASQRPVGSRPDNRGSSSSTALVAAPVRGGPKRRG